MFSIRVKCPESQEELKIHGEYVTGTSYYYSDAPDVHLISYFCSADRKIHEQELDASELELLSKAGLAVSSVVIPNTLEVLPKQ